MVVVPLPASDHRRPYSVYLRSGIVKAHSRRSSDGSVAPELRLYWIVSDQVYSPDPSHCVLRVTKPWIGTFNARITQTSFEGSVSGDAWACTSPQGSKYSNRNRSEWIVANMFRLRGSQVVTQGLWRWRRSLIETRRDRLDDIRRPLPAATPANSARRRPAAKPASVSQEPWA